MAGPSLPIKIDPVTDNFQQREWGCSAPGTVHFDAYQSWTISQYELTLDNAPDH
ncbi:hypothetical protein GCM10009113_36140 [Marinobacter szutsaonensis]